MDNTKKELLALFSSIWEKRSDEHERQTVERWDERAIHWKESLSEKEDNNKSRNVAIVNYLKSNGVLNKCSNVIDVGAGIGLSAIEMSEYVNSVLCIDYSKNMCKVGEELVKSKNINNIKFEVCDFENVDIESKMWDRNFDLAFSAISPAIRSVNALEKYMKLSKNYCFNASFVERPISKGGNKHPDRETFTTMIHMLLLMGYSPKIDYYTDKKSSTTYGFVLWRV